MSYLNGPRINFWGGGSTNVDTANNADAGVIDLLDAAIVSPPGDDDAIIAQLRQPATRGGQPYFTNAGWNYYGDHQVLFQGVKVSTYGSPGAIATDDTALAGAPVYLLGSLDPTNQSGPYGGAVMVDLDPTSSQSTRIYVGGLQIGSSDAPLLVLRYDTHCHSHQLGLRYDPQTTQPPFATPGSAWANGTFQLGFPASAVVSYDATVPAIKALVETPNAIGIVVRFCMFEYMPGKSTAEVQADYAANYNNPNPSLGRILGTLGPWFAGEPATCPAGRLLQNQNLGGASGVAYLNPTSNLLSLDLSSALQGAALRTDAKANTAPFGPNVDYGDLQVSAGGVYLASTPSLPDKYYLFGGIYDVALDATTAAAAAGAALGIAGTKSPLAIAEAPLRIYSDTRNIYIDEVGGKLVVDLIVSQFGGPVPVDTTINLSTTASGTFSVAPFLNYPTSVTVSAGTSSVSFVVSDNGGGAGFVQLGFGPAATPTYFANFRKYPRFNYTKVLASGSIPWSFVYEQCLRYYYVLFPAMVKRIPLNSEATVTAVAGEFLKRLSDAFRPTTLYMPLTRSLSPDKVNLLRAYLHQVSGGSGGGTSLPAGGPPTGSAVATATKPVPQAPPTKAKS